MVVPVIATYMYYIRFLKKSSRYFLTAFDDCISEKGITEVPVTFNSFRTNLLMKNKKYNGINFLDINKNRTK